MKKPRDISPASKLRRLRAEVRQLKRTNAALEDALRILRRQRRSAR